jgi:CheY-like chemotaxis protein
LGEAQLRERVAQAEALNRTKDEFLAAVSHDLRTPLNAILGWAALLQSHPDTASVTTGLSVILRNAEAQAKLIDDILDMARLAAGNLSLELGQCNLVELVLDAVESIRPAAQARQIRLNVDVPEASDQHGLTADPARLRQVVWNLLSNAIKFSEPGGEVAISLERRETEFVIVVRDSGRGIDDAMLPLVFERFWQGDTSTARRSGGLGLGLAIVRHIVELHGGEVTASSAGAGRGAEFRVRLPASSLPVVANQSREEPLALGSEALAGVRVLVLDDEPDHRDFMATVLARAGAEVQLAPSAGHALDYIVDFNPEVLVSDIAMPDEDGYRFIQQVRALDWPAAQTVPALAVTAYTRPEDRAAALARGFSAHLGKPVLPASLVLTVQGLVRAQRLRA